MSLFALLLMLTPVEPRGPKATDGEMREASRCGTFPAAVPGSQSYGGMSDCYLSTIDEKPLWRNLPDDQIQTLRFTFLHGHGLYFRLVRIDTLPDGRGRMVVDGTNYRRSIRRDSKRIKRRTIRLSSEQMAEINRLVMQSGTFEHEIGTWDKTENDMEIFLHCQTLDMERADGDGYRMSSVNIGCNHPNKLMPLIDEIVRLARLKQDGEGARAYY